MKLLQSTKSSSFSRATLVIVICLFLSLSVSYPQTEPLTFTKQASEMLHSQGVTLETDHAALWGLRQAYAWVGCPAQDIPFRNFSVIIEASGDSATSPEGQISNRSVRWPLVGVAINDSSNVLASAEVTSQDWTEISLGEVALADSDSMLYFVFMNDYLNRQTGEDVNLRIRRIRFVKQPALIGRVIVS